MSKVKVSATDVHALIFFKQCHEQNSENLYVFLNIQEKLNKTALIAQCNTLIY